MRVHNIVLTGGPCGGKTTAISYLVQKLQEIGFFVIVVPESATLCISAGISPISEVVGPDIAQRAIIQTAYNLEEIFRGTAYLLKKDVVILHDRGITDCRAYTELGKFDSLIKQLGMNIVSCRDDRYDAVFHLVTAADGAEEYYTLANNSARYETAEEARKKDREIINAWTGHPHLRMIDNSTDFEGKLRRLRQEVCSFLGIPVPIEKERKFLVRVDWSKIPEDAQEVEIEQVYLAGSEDGRVLRLRKRGQFGFYTYYETTKIDTEKMDERVEFEHKITEAEYNFGIRLIQKGTSPVRKKRTCFFYKDQYFELDNFGGLSENILGADDLLLLELESTSFSREISFPEWVDVVKDVTGDSKFSNHEISKRI